MTTATHDIRIAAGDAELEGMLAVPDGATGLVVFAHGSGSSRHSSRNQAVAQTLRDTHGLGTLLFDLLTADEDAVDQRTREHRFDIGLLSQRVVDSVDWLVDHGDAAVRSIGLFGASTGAAAALVAAARRPKRVKAVVSRGGRPDLAGDALPKVDAPTLLIVGSLDTQVIELNRAAKQQMTADVTTEIVPGATHLFEEPGTLERAARLAGEFFTMHLSR